jgi:hypothetical protein
MPYGTANAKLKKNIMFSLLQQLGQDVCHRCSTKIENVKELTVEHILPWLDVYSEELSSKLFWNLNNIGFSHLKCNIRASRRHTPAKLAQYALLKKQNTIENPNGKARCSKCKIFKLLEEFYTNKAKKNGIHSECKLCDLKRKAK